MGIHMAKGMIFVVQTACPPLLSSLFQPRTPCYALKHSISSSQQQLVVVRVFASPDLGISLSGRLFFMRRPPGCCSRGYVLHHHISKPSFTLLPNASSPVSLSLQLLRLGRLTQLNHISNHPHNQETHPDRLADAQEFALVRCNTRQFPLTI